MITENSRNKETVSAMLETERITNEPFVKGHSVVDELFTDLAT